MALSCAAVRTLIVSDLHLGLRSGVEVLRRPEPLARLLQALDGVDRLVLLGDVLELPVVEHAARAAGRRADAARDRSHARARSYGRGRARQP